MSLLNSPIVKNLLKNKLSEVIDGLDNLESSLVKYVKSNELLEGETHCAIFTDIDNEGRMFFCVGAFNKKEMVRLIRAEPAKEFIKTMLQNALNEK